MLLEILLYLVVFASAAALSVLLTRFQIAAALRFGWVDIPSPRKVHTVPTPRLGGVPMYAAFALVVGAMTVTRHLDAYSARGILAGGAALVLVGFVDDVWGLGPGLKLLLQTAVAISMAFGFDLAIQLLSFPGVGTFQLGGTIAGRVFTVLWILGMINTVNLSDGIDGLAAGLSVVFAVLLFVVALRAGQPYTPLYACALAGTALGFLRYNFSPARIFMGDSGSMFLGLVIAILSVMGSTKVATALLVMGLPVVDVAYSILRRVRTGAPVQMPDKEHLHHRFLSLGFSQRTTALFFYGLALAFGSAALIRERVGRLAALVVLAALALGVIWLVNERLMARSASASRAGELAGHGEGQSALSLEDRP